MQIDCQDSKRKRTEKLAAALLRDRARPTSTNASLECFTCGHEYSPRRISGDDNPRFCSKRCQDGYDAGFPTYDPNHVRALTNLPPSAWVLPDGTRYYAAVLRGSKTWRRLGKSAGWTIVHKLKIHPKKPNKINSLQGDFWRPTDRPVWSDWKPANNIDPKGVPDIPPFLDRRPKALKDAA